MLTYPIFTYEISRINYIFDNLPQLPSDGGGFIDKLKNAVKDCVNSPCNLFTQSSTSIGKLSQGILFSTNGTTLPVAGLQDSFAVFTGGIDMTIFNRIPEAFQRGLINLKHIGKAAWSESLNMLTKDNLPELIAKASSGQSLRTNTRGYRYTPDLKSAFDLNAIGAELLGGIASDMGDCFRRYQHAYRYNPYDPAQNRSSVSKAPLQDQVNGVVYHRNSFGQSVQANTGGDCAGNLQYGGAGNRPLPPLTLPASNRSTTSTTVDQVSQRFSIYSSWLDTKSNTFYRDLSLTQQEATKGGKTDVPGVMIGQDSYTEYKRQVSEGITDNTNLTTIDKSKFNNGFAINLNYLAVLFSNQTNIGELREILSSPDNQSSKWIYAAISKNGGQAVNCQLIDTCIESDTIKLTPYAYEKIIGPIPKAPSTSEPVTFDDFNVVDYLVSPMVNLKVTFFIGVIGNLGAVNRIDPAQLRAYIEQRIPSYANLYNKVPIDGPNYGITTGSPQEWAAFFSRLCNLESGFKNSSTGDAGKFDGGSHGLFQLSRGDALNYNLNNGRPYTFEQLRDPYINTDATLTIANRLIGKVNYIKGKSGSNWAGLAAYWGPIRVNSRV